MPGMNSGLDATNPALVAAFRSALLHQLAIVTAIFVLLLAYLAARTWLRRDATGTPAPPPGEPSVAEPGARRMLRIGFGVLWLLDGVLQAQPQMPGGLPTHVIGPVAAASPPWVRDLVNAGGSLWSYHPVQAATSVVWIQAGLGIWLIAAPRGWPSRLAGLASVLWGLAVWVFGEAFGGIFAPGLTWLTGAPGAVVLYMIAGSLIALPLRAWSGPLLGRSLLAGVGACWAGFAVLQAWPGRGFWQGASGTLTGMVQSMAQANQPHAQAAMVSSFADFTSAHGFAVNLFVVCALAGLGLAIGTARPRVLRVALPAATVFCLADWALVQDFGVPGGLGTDPNSMVPWLLLAWAGYHAVVWNSPERAVVPAQRGFSVQSARAALHPVAIRSAVSSASARSLTALGACGVILVGAVPMAAASTHRTADPIIARILVGTTRVDRIAPGFRLVSESGREVSLTSLRGKVVLLTFLDPVCPGCTTIAEEMHTASSMLGGDGGQLELVAIAASTEHSAPVFIHAFDHQAGLTTVPNWLFLSGQPAQLEQVWNRYEAIVPHLMDGMNPHSDVAFVIDKAGWIREEVGQGTGTAAARSSMAALLAASVQQVLN